MAGFEEDGEAGLDAGDAAPDAEEIGVGFEVGSAGGVVGGDHVDVVLKDVLPERVEIGSGSQGRSAFGDGAEADHVVIGEEEVVRAGLDGEVRAAGAGFEGGGDSTSGTDVDDV